MIGKSLFRDQNCRILFTIARYCLEDFQFHNNYIKSDFKTLDLCYVSAKVTWYCRDKLTIY